VCTCWALGTERQRCRTCPLQAEQDGIGRNETPDSDVFGLGGTECDVKKVTECRNIVRPAVLTRPNEPGATLHL
jgi:hypothetical protein